MQPLRRPRALRPGDRVRIVSPASTPSRRGVEAGVGLLSSWGLKVEVAPHVFDEFAGFLAGTDAARASDLNDALRDPGVRAVFASRGGKGAYRLLELLDYSAVEADPKLVVGFSEVTIIHLAILQRCSVPGIHGPFASWSFDGCGPGSAERLRRAVMTTEAVDLRSDASESTSALTTSGAASGPLVGGNLDMVRTAAGSCLPELAGAILLIEDPGRDQIGRIDRSLHQLRSTGLLRGVAGVAVGQFGDIEPRPGRWTVIDVLRDQLSRLGVPILGGLPLGHGLHPATTPVGTQATLDAEAGTMTVEAATS
jgi:muramoyltetrapeptide carboxypeptidase